MLKKALFSLIVGLLTFCLIYFISTQTTLFTSMERSLLDGFYYMREPGVNKHNRLVSNRVMLLGYDEKSLAAIGKWPWDQAIARFSESLELERVPDGKTTPSQVYIQRCKTLKQHPPAGPGQEWDGVYRLTEK